MTKASMGNLAKGLAFIVVGMALALGIWNVLLAMDVVYISSKRTAMTQLIPILGSVPGAIIFMIWFFNRKAKGERSQVLGSDLYTFAGFMVGAVALNVIFGILGVVLVGFKYFTAGAIDLVIVLVLQVLFCWLAFSFCPPYPRR